MKKIEKTVYDAIPDDATWEDLADGIDINFTYKGEKYSFNSKVVSRPRIMQMDKFMDTILSVGASLVNL